MKTTKNPDFLINFIKEVLLNIIIVICKYVKTYFAFIPTEYFNVIIKKKKKKYVGILSL